MDVVPRSSTLREPLLSVVAVSRNDDHGGDLTSRMQCFVDGFVGQCRRHLLDAELILVEWNPPPDRPPLEASLAWPAEPSPAQIRVITVPTKVHLNFPHASDLPIFQMIAKNVGIRRARGKYVLATNVDILFNDALVQYLRDALYPGEVLRVDRYDVPRDLHKKAPLHDILAECERRFFYVNTRLGTFDVKNRQIVGIGSGIRAQMLAAFLEARMFGLKYGARRIARTLPLALSHKFASLFTMALSSGRAIARLIGATRHRRLALLATLPARAFRRCVRWPRSFIQGLSGRVRRLKSSRRIHTNACGDFTLLAREDWARLRGYPEWPIHSWHLDSAFLFGAAAQGLVEVALGPRYRIYHIDHGSGWSPSGAAALFAGLTQKRIPYLTNEDLKIWHEQVLADPANAIMNSENWGLADHQFEERRIVPREHDLSFATTFVLTSDENGAGG